MQSGVTTRVKKDGKITRVHLPLLLIARDNKPMLAAVTFPLPMNPDA